MSYQPFGTGLKDEQRKDLVAALEASGLNWMVEKQPLYLADGREIPKMATVRVEDGAYLGVVNPTYGIVQNIDAFRVAEDIVNNFGGEYDYGGYLRGGAVVFLAIDLGNVFPEDPMKQTLLIINSHDGSTSVTGKILSTRVACWNMIYGARGSRVFRITHSATAEERLAIARQLVAETYEYSQANVKLYKKLLGVSVNKMLAERYLKKLYEVENEEQKRRLNKVENILSIFENSPAIVGTAAEGTLWGVFNAVSEYEQYHNGHAKEKAEKFISYSTRVEGFQKKALRLALEFAS